MRKRSALHEHLEWYIPILAKGELEATIRIKRTNCKMVSICGVNYAISDSGREAADQARFPVGSKTDIERLTFCPKGW